MRRFLVSYGIVFLSFLALNLYAQHDSLISERGDFKVMISAQLIQAHRFLESQNGGETWDTVSFKIEQLRKHDYGFLLSFNAPSPVRMLTENHWVIPGFDGTFEYKGELIVSKDQGRNWALADMPDFIKSIHRDRIHFSSPQYGVVLGHSHYATTQDSGYTWQLHKYPINVSYYRNEFKWLNDTLGVLEANYETIYTKDGGQSWIKTVPSSDLIQLDREDALLSIGSIDNHILLDDNYALVLVHSTYQKQFSKKNQLALHEPQDEIDFLRFQKRLNPLRLKHGSAFLQVREKDEILLDYHINLKPNKVYVLSIEKDSEGTLKITENKAIASFCQEAIDGFRKKHNQL